MSRKIADTEHLRSCSQASRDYTSGLVSELAATVAETIEEMGDTYVTKEDVLPIANGGTGAATFTSGAALIGNGTNAVTTRSITNNTAATTALTASTNLVTMNTLRYALNRTTGINSADTNYSTNMMRGISAGTAAKTAGSTSMINGTIYLQYE